jgi:hypothetical protein
MKSDETEAGKKRAVRAIAVGNRINWKATLTEATYCAELEHIVGLALPHMAPDRANLVVLAEILGLPAALIGPRGALARRAHNSHWLSCVTLRTAKRRAALDFMSSL